MNSQDVILGMLMKKSLSGYEMRQNLQSRFSYFFDASYSTIYPMLTKMEKEGFIQKETIIQEGRPNKNQFTITEEGKKRFFSYMSNDLEEDTYKSDFLMRLFFGEFVDKETLLKWIRAEIEKTRLLKENLSGELERIRPYLSSSQELCMRIGIRSYEAKLEVLESELT